MKIEYDKEVDAVYIRIQEKEVAHTKEIEEGITLDLDNEGKIIFNIQLKRYLQNLCKSRVAFYGKERGTR